MKTRYKILVAGGLLIACQAPLLAQNSTSQLATSSAKIIAAISINPISELDYGNVIPPPSGTGTVDLEYSLISHSDQLMYNPSSMDPGVADRAEPEDATSPHTAHIVVSGEPGTSFTISVPASIELNPPGISISPYVSPTESSNGGVFPSGGSVNIYVGGTLNVAAGTPRGEYEVQFNVTASYN